MSRTQDLILLAMSYILVSLLSFLLGMLLTLSA